MCRRQDITPTAINDRVNQIEDEERFSAARPTQTHIDSYNVAAQQFGEKGGAVVNISSVVSTAAIPNAAVYSATKAAVDAVTRSLAAELGPKNVRVNSVNPGMVETEGTHAQGITESDFRKQVEAQTPLGRIGRVDDIAPVVTFLASDDAKWVTGQVLNVSGGNR